MLVREDLADLYKQAFKSQRFKSIFSTDFALPLWAYLCGNTVGEKKLSKDIRNFFLSLRWHTYKLLDPLARHMAAIEDLFISGMFFRCVERTLPRLPFGDVPRKFTDKVVKASRAARTFVEGLDVGFNTLTAMKNIMMNIAKNQCLVNLMKTSYCSWCSGNSGLKPCQDNCLRVYKDCFQESMQIFSPHWDDYIAALVQMMELLEGPSGFEAVISRIDVDISEALTNMQQRFKTGLKDKVLILNVLFYMYIKINSTENFLQF